MTKHIKTKITVATAISVMIAVLAGFGIWLGHAIATKVFLKIVEATGVSGEFTPYLIVFMGVIVMIILLAMFMIYVLHKKFSILKVLKKFYRL